MAANQMAKKKVPAKGKKGTRVVRPYPQVPLEKVLCVVSAIKDKNGGNPLAPALIAEYCGVSMASTDIVYLLSASARFGLTTGSSKADAIELTEKGHSIAYAGTPEEEEKLKKAAFLGVDIFKRVFEHYKGSQLPEMKYLGNTLQSQFGLVPELHEEFSRLFRENTKYLKLTGYTAEEGEETAGARETPPGAPSLVVGQPKKKGEKKVCFVIIPFKERYDQHPAGFFNEVLNSLIIPAVTEAGFEVRTANRQGTEIIHSTIVNDVLDADLAVCDLTEHNPNVLFELGMRLAHEKPVALIHAEGTERVFDVDNVLRVLSYDPNLWRTTIEKNTPELREHVEATWDNKGKSETYIGLLRKIKTETKS
jgi:hypothetical protein